MNRVCFQLQSQDMWLGLKVHKLFSTKIKADEYFNKMCSGCGIICKVRAISEDKKFKDGMDVTPDVSITTNWRRKKGKI